MTGEVEEVLGVVTAEAGFSQVRQDPGCQAQGVSKEGIWAGCAMN